MRIFESVPPPRKKNPGYAHAYNLAKIPKYESAFTKFKEMFSGKRGYLKKIVILTGFHKRFLKIVKNFLFDFIKSRNFPKINHRRRQRGSTRIVPVEREKM